MSSAIQDGPSVQAPAIPTRLGEELPIFCEKCGYSLHGLGQLRCERCEILHFHCPECGHHQPINTLRPAFQRMLGRARAAGLILLVLFQLNYFGWLLFAWGALAGEWCLQYRYVSNTRAATLTPRPFQIEEAILFGVFALAFSMIGRMLLLRWRRSALVGVTIGTLVVLAMLAGIALRVWEVSSYGAREIQGTVWNMNLVQALSWVWGFAVIGALIVWPIWVMLVRAFLPEKLWRPLLEWQKSLSDRSAAALGRQ